MNILKGIWCSIATRFIPQMLAVSLKRKKHFKHKNQYNDTYMNYLRRTEGTPKQQWDRITFVVKYPIVIISLVIGFGSIPFILICETLFIKTIFTALSTIGLGVGVNYFTFYLKETREYKILNEIGEYTVKRLSIKIENILSKDNLNQHDKDNITDFLDLIDKWKDYIDYADTSRISIHKRLKHEIEYENDEKKKDLLKNRISSMEYNWVSNGLGSFIDISGSTSYQYYIPPRLPI